MVRAVVNAIFYIAQSGCQWRMLPKDFPPFTTVQGYFYQWRDDGRWQTINHHLVMRAREAAGLEGMPRRLLKIAQQALPVEQATRPWPAVQGLG